MKHQFLRLLFGVVFALGATMAGWAQPVVSGDVAPAMSVEARIRNGNTGFEAVLFTPANPSPTGVQLNPNGAPIWNQNGNTYGLTYFDFEVTYDYATGTVSEKIDFNHDNSYGAGEVATSVNPTLVGKGFEYTQLFVQGNATAFVDLDNYTINGTNFGSYTTDATTQAITTLYEDASSCNLFTNLTITGTFTFTASGGGERPRIWVSFGGAKDADDLDCDGIPNALDIYANDATNNGKAAIYAFVWDDQDGDGIQDAGEPGIGNAQVYQRNGGGGYISTGATNNGAYKGHVAFFNINTGDSRILEFVKPSANHAHALQNQGGDDNLDSDHNPANGQTASFVCNGVVTNQDGGLLAPGTVNARVWDDLDGDGIQDLGEPGIENAPVHLFRSNNSFIATDLTDANGIATFTNVPAGQGLKLRFDTKTGNHWRTTLDQGGDDTKDSDGDQSTGYTADFTLTSGSQVYEDMDGGQWAPGTVKAFVWDDQNGDGIQGPLEPAISGSPVHLFRSNNSFLASANTDANGIATFNTVPAGQGLKLRFDPKDGNHWRTVANVGGDLLDSDGDQGTGYTADFTLTSGSQVYEDMDGGQWAPGTVIAFVWDDQNGDGLQDPLEPGIDGSPVYLFTGSGSYLATATTTGGGYATFNGVAAGQARKLRFDPKTGNHWRTLGNIGGDDTKDSDGNQGDGYTANFTLTQGSQVFTDHDGGQWAPGTVIAFVWDDQNGDGIQDPLEPGIDGSPVYLFTGSGSYLATATTTGGGYATFTGVAAGQARKLRFDPKNSNHWRTLGNVGGDLLDSDGDQSTGYTADFTLTQGSQVFTDHDGGQWAPGTVEARVWQDTDYDGIQDVGEPNIVGSAVHLFTGSGSYLASATTNGSGIATFTNVAAGQARKLRFDKAATNLYAPGDVGSDDEIDSDIDHTVPGNQNYTINFNLTKGSQNYTAMDCGLVPISLDTDGDGIPNYLDLYALDASNNGKPAIISRAWDDRDGDGIQDTNEPGVGGVTVRLRKSNGDQLGMKSTHPTDGLVAFFDLSPTQSVYLQYSKPVNSAIALKDMGANDNVDSDIDGNSGSTAAFVPVNVVSSWDGGLLLAGTITTFVWNDLDGDGIQDTGEPGINNVTVRLRKINGDVIGTATTVSSGNATFTNVPAGLPMKLEYVKPAGHTITGQDLGGNDTKDSDPDQSGYTAAFTLTLGSQSYTIADAGMWVPGTVTTFVWDDQNGDGIQDGGEPGINNVTVRIRKPNGDVVYTAVTGANGLATFTNVPTGTPLKLEYMKPAGHTFTGQNAGSNDALDSDADATGYTALFTLTQGSQLYTSDDAGLWAPGTITTFVWDDQDADGIQDGNEPGISNVTVHIRKINGDVIGTATTGANGEATFINVPTGLQIKLQYVKPAGHTMTIQDAGTDDALDSDAAADGYTGLFSLTMGSQLYTIADGGMWAPGTIATLVWNDANGDGLQDDVFDEPGISGVTVKLRKTNGDVVQSAITDANGVATFNNVFTAVQYKLEYIKPSGYNFSPKDVGVNDAVDSDAATNGYTDLFSLNQGSQMVIVLDCGLVESFESLLGGNDRDNQVEPVSVDLMSLYPNPVTSVLNIVVQSEEAGEAQYMVHDVMGRLIYQGKWLVEAGENRFQIQNTTMSAGTYQLSIIKNDKVTTSKFMVANP